MKIIFFVFSILFSPLVFAQSIDADWMFAVGDSSNFSRIEINNTLDPGPGGVNITWDFSMIDDGNALEYNVYFNKADAYGLNSFTEEANFSSFNDIGNQGIYYYIFDGDYLLTTGDSLLIGSKFTFIPPLKLFSFPLSINDTIDNFCTASLYDNDGNVFLSNDVSVNRTLDGAGTVITPFGTFENCIRVKEVYMSETILIETYEWYYEKLSNKIAEMLVQPSQNKTFISWQTNINDVMINTKDIANADVYISQLGGNRFLVNELEGSFSISVYDVDGRTVETKRTEINHGSLFALNQDYTSGQIYFMLLVNEQTGAFYNYKFVVR